MAACRSHLLYFTVLRAIARKLGELRSSILLSSTCSFNGMVIEFWHGNAKIDENIKVWTSVPHLLMFSSTVSSMPLCVHQELTVMSDVCNTPLVISVSVDTKHLRIESTPGQAET